MRSFIRTEAQMLANEAKRFPKVAALLERVHLLTDEEIENADVPLKWYKKALRTLRDQTKDKLASQQAFESKMLEFESYIVDGSVPDPVGEVREWIGSETWLELDRGHILVQPGTLIWLPMSGGVWIQTLFQRQINSRIHLETKHVGVFSKTAYTEAYKDAAASRAGIKLYTWGEEEEKKAFTIYRID